VFFDLRPPRSCPRVKIPPPSRELPPDSLIFYPLVFRAPFFFPPFNLPMRRCLDWKTRPRWRFVEMPCGPFFPSLDASRFFSLPFLFSSRVLLFSCQGLEKFVFRYLVSLSFDPVKEDARRFLWSRIATLPVPSCDANSEDPSGTSRYMSLRSMAVRSRLFFWLSISRRSTLEVSSCTFSFFQRGKEMAL